MGKIVPTTKIANNIITTSTVEKGHIVMTTSDVVVPPDRKRFDDNDLATSMVACPSNNTEVFHVLTDYNFDNQTTRTIIDIDSLEDCITDDVGNQIYRTGSNKNTKQYIASFDNKGVKLSNDPPTLYRNSNGDLSVVTGFGRINAALSLDYENFIVDIIEDPTDQIDKTNLVNIGQRLNDHDPVNPVKITDVLHTVFTLLGPLGALDNVSTTDWKRFLKGNQIPHVVDSIVSHVKTIKSASDRSKIIPHISKTLSVYATDSQPYWLPAGTARTEITLKLSKLGIVNNRMMKVVPLAANTGALGKAGETITKTLFNIEVEMADGKVDPLCRAAIIYYFSDLDPSNYINDWIDRTYNCVEYLQDLKWTELKLFDSSLNRQDPTVQNYLSSYLPYGVYGQVKALNDIVPFGGFLPWSEMPKSAEDFRQIAADKGMKI